MPQRIVGALKAADRRAKLETGRVTAEILKAVQQGHTEGASVLADGVVRRWAPTPIALGVMTMLARQGYQVELGPVEAKNNQTMRQIVVHL